MAGLAMYQPHWMREVTRLSRLDILGWGRLGLVLRNVGDGGGGNVHV